MVRLQNSYEDILAKEGRKGRLSFTIYEAVLAFLSKAYFDDLTSLQYPLPSWFWIICSSLLPYYLLAFCLFSMNSLAVAICYILPLFRALFYAICVIPYVTGLYASLSDFPTPLELFCTTFELWSQYFINFPCLPIFFFNHCSMHVCQYPVYSGVSWAIIYGWQYYGKLKIIFGY